MNSPSHESKNLENTNNRAPTWYARLNQGCLVLFVWVFGLFGLGHAAKALTLDNGPEKIMLLVAGMGTAAAALAISWKVMQKRTFELLRRKWTTFLHFIGF